MHDSIKRCFLIFIGIVGMVLSGTLIVRCLNTGSAPSPILAGAMAGHAYQRATQGSQFWFVLLLFGAAFVAFGWIAWRAHRS